jgi:hypothetical protein
MPSLAGEAEFMYSPTSKAGNRLTGRPQSEKDIITHQGDGWVATRPPRPEASVERKARGYTGDLLTQSCGWRASLLSDKFTPFKSSWIALTIR